MEYDLILNVESCHIQLPWLLYYSHYPSIIASLFFGFFVFFKSGRSLLGKILLSMSIAYSLWAICSLIVWITVDSRVYSFFWSFFEMLSIIFYFLVLYFGYVFIEEKDVSFKVKLLFLILFFPVAIISSTKYYLAGFDAATCDAIMNDNFLYYIYFLKSLTFVGVLLLLLSKYVKYRKDEIKKTKIVIVGIGLIFLLLSFLSTQYFGDFVSADLYKIEFYGLFAVDVFIGFLAYLIVRYKAFNIKLLGTQALVVLLIFLIGALLFYVQETGGKILIVINLILALFFGWLLVKSVKQEVKQREALEIANKEINERKEQLQKLSDSLAVANDKLKRMDATKTDFINIASHQLKKVPTPIKGYLSLLLEGSYGEIPKEQRRVLENVNSANDRQIHLVDDLLDVARMESGRVELDFQKQQMENICQEVYTTLLPNAKEKGLELSYEKPKNDLPELIIDKGKVFEAIFNFVDNAIKYTPKGKVDLKVELTPQSNYKPLVADDGQKGAISGSVVRVTVSDTGMGILKESIPYLFAKFSRKDTSHLNANGTGLGLYVVKLMVEAHGGRTWAESDGEGKGSRFIIEVPTKQPEEVSVKN